MKKLSKEETSNVSGAKAKYNLVRGVKTQLGKDFIDELDSVEEGESVFIQYAEWPIRMNPPYPINSFYKSLGISKKFQCLKLRSKDGWLLVRIL